MRKVAARWLASLVTVALLVGTVPGSAAAAAAQPAAAQGNFLNIQAKAALLLAARSDQVLYSYNPDLRIQPASLAKIMTFLLALEALRAGRIQLTTKVTISKAAWELALQLGKLSDMDLQVGTKVPFQDLLYGLVVSSGNDAAVAIAEAVAGSQSAFVAEMNARARQLGLSNTHFATVHGLPAADQYTTAADMAKLARYVVLNYPNATQYTSRHAFTWNGITQNNWNLPLLLMDPRVFGLKTGHITAAGYHLVATAKQGNQLLVAVVLGTSSDHARAVQAEALLKYGFGTWDTVQVSWAHHVPASMPVWAGKAERVAIRQPAPVWVSVPRQQATKLAVTASLRTPVVAPVAAGAVLGSLHVTVAGQPLRTVPLLAAKAVGRGGLVHVLWDRFRLFIARLWRHLHL